MFEVVIVNWNAGEQLYRCLESLGNAFGANADLARVVVVDNASTDGSANDLAIRGLPITILHNRVNRGFAAACNQGAKGSQADYLLFLNPDVRLSENAIRPPIEFLEAPENAGVGIVGIQLFDEGGRLQRSCARFPTPSRILYQSIGLDKAFPARFPPHFMLEWSHDSTKSVDQVIGAFLLVRRKVFERLNGFDERFFLYYEDVDFCLRAKRLGWDVTYFAGAVARHTGGGTTAAIPARRLFYSLRSKIIFARKHFGLGGQAATLLATALLEPLSRSAHAIAGRSHYKIRHVSAAFALLYLSLITGVRGRAP